MSRSAKKPCRESGCPALVDVAGYCDKHKRTTRAASGQGKTTTQRGYGSSWVKLRKVIISRDHGLCQPCLRGDRVTAFDAVDHIIPKVKGGTDALSNLQCICDACHKIKTAQEDSK